MDFPISMNKFNFILNKELRERINVLTNNN